ncbi:MAG: hypothetical protein AAGI01_12365, partial [Myxococcota bacterium]
HGTCTTTEAVRRHVLDVLSQEHLTRAFFTQLRVALDALSEHMLHGPEEPAQRHDLALMTLLRLIVLYFLQSRGALDHDPRFIARATAAARDRGEDVWRDVLARLCFQALNTPLELRDERVLAMGNFPFLNGGLFEPSPLELQHPALTWPAKVWTHVLDELFERFTFALHDALDETSSSAVDPETIGRVFEGLMREDVRSHTGSFYTPRHVVRAMTRESLLGQLAHRTSLERGVLSPLFDGEPIDAEPGDLACIAGVIRSLRILDPAAGTGAFLLEALHTLRRIWRGLRRSGARGCVDPDTSEGVRMLIHEHLFGVDVQPTATRLCELRLWLAIVTIPAPDDADDVIATMRPLPNLSHRISSGDALISPLDYARQRTAPGGSERAWVFGIDAQLRELVGDITTHQARWLDAHGEKKQRTRRALERAEEALDARLIARRLEILDARIEARRAALESPDLFGALPDASALRRELRAWRDERDALAKPQTSPLHSTRRAFSFESRFAEVMAEGGFDVVLTNPPWVRAGAVDAAMRRVLHRRYASARHGLWPEAHGLGVRAPFGAQPDLAALFVERSLELLRPGGSLAALIPAKLLRGLHGSALRGILYHHDLIAIEDRSGATEPLFDAATYPAILHLRRARPAAPGRRVPRHEASPRPLTLRAWSGQRARTWHAQPDALLARGEHPGEPWVLVEDQVRRAMDTMNLHPTLGAAPGLKPRRGILTGRNAIFLPDAQTRAHLGLSDTWYRPVVGGRDLSMWEPRRSRPMLWPYDEDMRPLRSLPTSLWAYFDEARQALTARSDWRRTMPIWQLFRVQRALDAPKVAWRDFSPLLEACVLDAQTMPLNTAYYIACADARRARALVALCHSAPARAYVRVLAERARGGWRRHFAWVLAMLPIPSPWLAWWHGEAPEPAGLLDAARARDLQDIDRIVAELYGLSTSSLAAMQRVCGEAHGEGRAA